MTPLDPYTAIIIGKQRCNELRGETPRDSVVFFKPNLKKTLAGMFYAWAARLEPWRYPVKGRRRTLKSH